MNHARGAATTRMLASQKASADEERTLATRGGWKGGPGSEVAPMPSQTKKAMIQPS